MKHARTTLPLALGSLLLSPTLASRPQQTASTRAEAQRLFPSCAEGIVDQNDGSCLQASSVPTPGLLFPPPHDGGIGNVASGPRSFIGGGVTNTAGGPRSAILGGRSNIADGSHATVGGGFENESIGDHAVIGGGFSNAAAGVQSTVGGGRSNSSAGADATVGGGFGNVAAATSGTVSGGMINFVYGTNGAIGGGVANKANGESSTVGGGLDNAADGSGSTVSGGGVNIARSTYSTVAGGFLNWIEEDARAATIVGGERNAIAEAASFAFAAGRRAHADHAGAFVWGDSQDVDKTSSLDDQFNVYASGGTRIFSDSAAANGVTLAPGAGSWSSVSDSDAKENIESIDAQEVLDRLTSIPISSWNYKTQDDSVRHVGPMAQDFYAAFGLGLGDRSIDTVDADGVALAAIQGLNEKLAEREREIEDLRARVDELEHLEAELDALRAAVARIDR